MKHNLDEQYLIFLRYILDNGVKKEDRTGTGTISVFDYTIKHKMEDGFPLLTSKKMFTKGIVHELIWFLKGDTNIKYLVDNGVNIWVGDSYKKYESSYKFSSDPIAYKNYDPKEGKMSRLEFIDRIKSDDNFALKYGELGPVYGKLWRDWDGIDQISNLINDLKNNPDSRRLMVTAWCPSSLKTSILPPCHYGFQCYTHEMSLGERINEWCKSLDKDVSYGNKFTHKDLDDKNFPKRKLSLKWTQRSCDSPLGIPFNLASYGLLLELLSKEVNMVSNELIFTGGDCHIYLNQIEGVKKQLTQESFDLPTIELSNRTFDGFKYDDFKLINYKSSPKIDYLLSN